jgi:hypothetical protein
MPVAWAKYEGIGENGPGEYVVSDLPISVSLNNQFHYYFRIVAYDLAGNCKGYSGDMKCDDGFNESYQDIIVDRDAPQKIRNLEIKDTKPVNGTTDIVISFMSSQSQDLSGYRIYRSTDENETGTVIGSLDAGDLYLSHRDSKVDLGYKYYYSVVAVDRMNFESEPETRFIVLEAEEPATVIEEDSESSNNPLFIGMGVIGVIALGGAGFYFLSNKAGNEIITGIGEASPSNFTEMDGEFLCGACGSMFEMTDDKTCPSCGTVDK